MTVVEVWAWSGCPSHEAALDRVTSTLAYLGHSDLPVTVRWVESDDDAVRLGFTGSPTVAVDGRDILPAPGPTQTAPGPTQTALTCRVYRRRDGRVSPLPDPDDLRDALLERIPVTTTRATPVTSTTDVVISATELQSLLASGADVVLLDVRRTADHGLRHEYEAGHLPGARYVDHITQLAGPRTDRSGKNPLPTEAQIQEAVTGWGIHPTSVVVVYTRGSAPAATRAWWVLTWAGVPDVRYLDGGLDAWTAAGGELSTVEPSPATGTFRVSIGSLPTIDADEAAELARTGLLLDARPHDAYVGDPAEPGKGHIPGALSVPYSDNLDDDGLLRGGDELGALYAAHGVDGVTPLGLYCGGGVGATTGILVLHRLGIKAALYPGSWTQWSSDPSRPVATGG